MRPVQLRLFELPDPEPAPEEMTIRVGAELPGPGWDHLVVDLVNDALSRLCHDSGLFAHRVEVEIGLEYVEDSWFGDDRMSIPSDTNNTNGVSAPMRHVHRE
jgi:hypothetical protein